LFDLVESIEVWGCCLRQRSALYFGAPDGGAVLAPAPALQFGASGGRNSNVARDIGIYSAVDASFAAPTYTSTIGDALSPLYLLFVPHQVNQALCYYSNSAIYDHSCYLYDMRTLFTTIGDALSPLYLLFVPHQINQALCYYSNSAIYDHSCYLYDMRTLFIHRCQID
jgi:hypothetical protein